MRVGERVAAARADAGLTQMQLASAVGLDRSALAKIETGARRVSAVELAVIARELRRRLEWFVDPGPEAVVSHRVANPDVATQYIDTELESLAREVEFVAGQEPAILPGQLAPLPRPATGDDAEALARQVRSLLGYASDDAAHALAARAASIGLLVFSFDLGADGADAGTVLLPSGGVSVVNGHRQNGRRRLALAHELGHYLVADPYTTDWRIAVSDSEPLEARLDRFARALLLPADDLRIRWDAWRGQPYETVRDAAVRAASHYQVDLATLAQRLTELRIVDHADADLVRVARAKRADVVEKDLVRRDELVPVDLPRPFERAVLRLYRSEFISADRALGLLYDTFDLDSLPDLPPHPESEIWSVVS